MKKYLANTTISVSVSLPNGGNARVSFSPLTDGTSVFYTNDEELQYALEHHYKFGKLFRLVEDTPDEKAAPSKRQSKAPASKSGKKAGKPIESPVISNEEAVNNIPEEIEAQDTDNENEASEIDEVTEYKEVVVSDMDAAKDYLADNFDVVRTKLKNEDSIKEAALAFGIIFKYL